MTDEKVPPVMLAITNSLGLAPMTLVQDDKKEEQESLPAVIEEPTLSKEDKEAEEDFYITRENTKVLIEKGQEALDGILRVAAGSEHPRAYEVAANLLKTMTEMNAGLLKLHEQRRQLVPDPEPEKKQDGKQITNNNLFIGSTQDFLDFLEEREAQDAEFKVIEHDSDRKPDKH